MKRLLSSLVAVVAIFGCASAPQNEDPGTGNGLVWATDTISDSAGEKYFKPVAEMMVRRCGTLDCHGQIGRNLRIYGKEGLRLDPDGSLGLVSGLQPTTGQEVLADYRSVVGLEPELIAQVWGPTGADFSTLTLIRKARGVESHKGGVVTLDANGNPDHADNCLTIWLSAKDPTTECTAALTETCPAGTKANTKLGSCDVTAN
jgi:hypothetical protein